MDSEEIRVGELLYGSSTDDFISEHTCRYFSGDVTASDVQQEIEVLSRTNCMLTDKRSCVIFGYGGQSKEIYEFLRGLDGVELFWDGIFSPWWLRPLAWIAASRGGFLVIHETREIDRVFQTLAARSMVELYSFSPAHLDEVRSKVKRLARGSNLRDIIQVDETYFCLGVDGDSLGSKTGIHFWCSFGKLCPSQLQETIVNLRAGNADHMG